jgi:hypothetical protein
VKWGGWSNLDCNPKCNPRGRALRLEEVTYITEVARRLKALLLLGADLDANYRATAETAMNLAAIKP